MFYAMWVAIWHHFANKNVPKNASKKGASRMQKQGTTIVSGGSQRRRLACALLEQETIARARNVVRIRVHGSGSEKLLGIAACVCFFCKCFKTNRKNGKGRCQKHMVRDLTRHGQRPGESFEGPFLDFLTLGNPNLLIQMYPNIFVEI